MVVFAKSEFLYIAPIWSEGAKRPENGTFQEKTHSFLIFDPITKLKQQNVRKEETSRTHSSRSRYLKPITRYRQNSEKIDT